MKAASPWVRAWADIKSLALPLSTFWIAALLSNICFTAAVLGTGKSANEDLGVLAGFWLGSISGLALGQAMALARLRPTLVLGGGAIFYGALWAFVFSYFVGQEATGLKSDVFAMAMIFWVFIAPFYFPCGFWSLSAHTGMLATFAPILGFTAAILIVSDARGDDSAWFAGDKWAIWSALTLPMLALAVMLVLVYLATREIHRLHRWKTSDRSPEMSDTVSAIAPGRPNPGCTGILALLLLGTFLTASTALIAPYLWRSEAAEDGDNPSTEPTTEPSTANEPVPTPSSGAGQPSPGEQLEEAAQQGIQSLLFLLLMLLLAILGIAVFGPPLRRTLLLAFLRRPFWPVPPTRRALQHWRLVEIALGDIGIPREPADSAVTLVERATQKVDFLDTEPLLHCAAIADRVLFGLGLQPDDVMMARRTAEMTYQTVWDELSEWAKLRAMYRIL